MKLELGFIEIKDIQFSKESKLENGILFVNADEAKNFVFGDDDVKACVRTLILTLQTRRERSHNPGQRRNRTPC